MPGGGSPMCATKQHSQQKKRGLTNYMELILFLWFPGRMKKEKKRKEFHLFLLLFPAENPRSFFPPFEPLVALHYIYIYRMTRTKYYLLPFIDDIRINSFEFPPSPFISFHFFLFQNDFSLILKKPNGVGSINRFFRLRHFTCKFLLSSGESLPVHYSRKPWKHPQFYIDVKSVVTRIPGSGNFSLTFISFVCYDDVCTG